MKKRQKVLLGLMALGLVGGIGSAVALTRTAATQQSTSGGTDKAVYLYWGDTDQQDAVTAEVKDLTANTTVYRYVVVAPKISKTLEGTVSVTFTLSVDSTENQDLTGLTINIWENSSATEESHVKDGEIGTLSLATGGTATATATFDVNGSTSTTPTKYYSLGFKWDGTSVADGKTFGGSLGVSQSFAEKTSTNA